jgi:RNA polymerase sigma-70 factor (ECF subfamily)
MRFDNSKWRGHRIDLLRYVGRRVGDAALREDIVQEAIVRALAYQAKPDVVVSNIPGLLRRISLDLIHDHFRRFARNRNVELTEEIPCSRPTVQEQLEQRQTIAIIIGVVKTMPRLRREVFFRRRVEGQSAKEAAEAMGISPGAVNAHMARAVLDLHLAIEKIEKRGGSVRG